MRVIVIVFAFILFCLFSFACNHSRTDIKIKNELVKDTSQVIYTGKVFRIQQEEAYGYSISNQSKVVINQLFFPAMQGRVIISDSIQADKLMNISLDKIRKGQFPPSLTQTEVLQVINSK